ncbi:Zinc finger A20 and AN1 domain-containing stress-associated protein 8-like protein [Drosera capensis]
MEHRGTGCQALDAPILCIKNCGFFGRAATMNMCSKCHKELILQQEQTKLVASSIDTIVNGSHGSNGKEPVVAGSAKPTPSRCSTCRKRVGLTGFICKCRNLFCSSHRYSDKHDCPFDYRAAGQDALEKANPVIKADKIDKI